MSGPEWVEMFGQEPLQAIGFWWTLALFIASTALSIALRPRVDSRHEPGQFAPPDTREGQPIPIVYGRGLVSPRVTWWGDVKVQEVTKTVSSGPFGIIKDDVFLGYRYLAGMQLVICHGPIDELTDIWVGERRLSQYDPTLDYGIFTLDPVELGLLPAPVTPELPIAQEANPTSVQVFAPLIFGGKEQGGGISGFVNFHWGTIDQPPNEYLSLFWGSQYTPNYRNICYAVLRRVSLGKSPHPEPWKFQVKKIPRAVDATKAEIGDGDANAAEIIYDLLTAPYALQRSPSLIDLPSFQAAAATLHAEGLGLSMVVSEQSKAGEALLNVVEHVNGVLYSDIRTGKITLDLIRADYSTIPEVNPQNATLLEFTNGSWAETVNETRVRYTNVEDRFQTRVAQAQNLAAIQAKGDVVTETYDLPAITTQENAQYASELKNRGTSVPMARGEFMVDRTVGLRHPGDPFLVSWPSRGISIVMRVVRIDHGTLQEGRTHVQAVQDVWNLSGIVYGDPNLDELPLPCGPLSLILPGYDPAQDPDAIFGDGFAKLIEAPYWHVGEASRVWAAVSRRSNAEFGWTPYRSEQGEPFERLDATSVFTPVATLEDDLLETTAASGVTIQVRNAGDLHLLDSTDAAGLLAGARLAVIDDEIIAWQTITDLGEGVYELGGVMRGQLDTVPTAHGASSRVLFYFADATMAPDISSGDYPDAQFVGLKPLRIDPDGEDAPDAVPTVSILTTGRAAAPYPPGNVELAGAGYAAWPDTVVGDAVLTWTHRSRSEQVEMVSQDDSTAFTLEGDLTIEAVIDGVVAKSWENVTGTTITYTLADRLEYSGDLSKPVTFRIVPLGPGGDIGTVRTTPPFVMAAS